MEVKEAVQGDEDFHGFSDGWNSDSTSEGDYDSNNIDDWLENEAALAVYNLHGTQLKVLSAIIIVP